MSSKPRVFIGSSSEGTEVAEILFQYLSADFRPFTWQHGIFMAGRFTLEELERSLREHEFAVLCATPDDSLSKRGNTSPAMRDNVLFELGLFIGALGRKRTFLVVPTGVGLVIPTDLAGLTYVSYDAERFSQGPADRMAALQVAGMSLRTVIHRTWAELRATEEQLARARMANARTTAIRRIHAVIVDLRDVIIELPGDMLQSLTSPKEFDRVKRVAAERVDKISAPMYDDATTAGVTTEFGDLVTATRAALLEIPYPFELFVEEQEIKQAAVKHIAGAIQSFNSGGQPFEYAGQAIESEVARRVQSISDRYRGWWTRSEKVLQRATSRLQTALVNAALESEPKQLPESARPLNPQR
ncbi:nucleotide-binding protein [Polyangium jinanense]|uniref:Nucleotide-binding protein n=1 Tax=Polyangium jinanense TaxID=2829994 RepID=A0A9X3XBP1_9BACT|nr:nucleotide-binding protein [Polyangium jinanense]MDC3985803.1 nucleotide-binding protein [Polyangium jinanense]